MVTLSAPPRQPVAPPSQIFVNLAVRDLARSKDFYQALGFWFEPRFTDDKAACLVISEGSIYAMLLTESFFATFTDKQVADARITTEALVALALESRAAVDEMITRAREAGARIPRPPVDHGFMYLHGFEDPDGHLFELFHMQEQMPEADVAAAIA